MIEYIESQGISVTKWEEQAMKDKVPVSIGYLRKALKNNTNIGFEILEYFLSVYPDVDIYWLLRIEKPAKMETNNTPVQNGSDNKEKSLGDDVMVKMLQEAFKMDSAYRVVPTSVLEGKYALYLEDEIKQKNNLLWTSIGAKDELIKELKVTIKRLQDDLSKPSPSTAPKKAKN